MNFQILKKIFFIFLILFSISLSFSVNKTTELYLDSGIACPNIEISFTVYNLTDWENKENIEEDDDLNFSDISGADVEIFNGPFDSPDRLLKELEIDSNNQFVYTFPRTDQFLIKIVAGGAYYNYEETFFVDECKFLNSNNNETEGGGETNTSEEEEIVLEPTPEDKEFSYENNIVLKLEQTTLNKESVTVSIENKSNYETINKTQEIISINSKESFNSATLEYTITTEENEEIKVYSLESNTWKEKIFTQEIDKISISVKNNETLLIAKESSTSVVKEEAVTEPLTTTTTNNNNNSSQEESGLNLSTMIIIVLVSLSILFGLYVLLSHKKVNKEIIDVPEEKTHNSQMKEQVKAYVNQYKASYNKEQIIQALLNANVEQSLIDEVIREEYN